MDKQLLITFLVCIPLVLFIVASHWLRPLMGDKDEERKDEGPG
jgi:hypothetical protein